VVEVYLSRGFGNFPTSYKETFTLHERQVINIQEYIEPNIIDARISVRLVPIDPNKAWAENVVIHNLRFNPYYNPSGPVEMFLPEEME